MSLDFWPRPRFKMDWREAWSLPTVAELEQRFSERLGGHQAVLFSSGRAGMYFILRLLQLGRADWVSLPPYVSHCVLSTISFVATPAPLARAAKLRLVYHQWGFPAHLEASGGEILLEDSVDSLIDDPSGLFPNVGRFELLSLPKIFGCNYGGVVICKEPGDAPRLRALRDAGEKLGHLHHLLRFNQVVRPKWLTYWSSTEPLSGPFPRWLLSNVAYHLDRWDEHIRDRKAKLAVVGHLSCHPSPMQSGRLPVCVPLDLRHEDVLKKLGLYVGRRNMTYYSGEEWQTQEILPLPVHQDVDMNQLKELATIARAESWHGV